MQINEITDSQARALAATSIATRLHNSGKEGSTIEFMKIQAWFDQIGVIPIFLSNGKGGYFFYSESQLDEIGAEIAIQAMPLLPSIKYS